MTMTSEAQIDLPALAGIKKDNPLPRLLRTLSPHDDVELKRSRLVYSIAAPLMRMYGVLVRNYQALHEFALSFAQKRPGDVDPMIELDRHVLNYLASAGAVLDHYDRAFKKRTKAIGKPSNVFTAFRKELESNNDIFQFFCEFRNYALHSALPVGHLSENHDIKAGRKVRILHNSKQLLADGRGDLKSCRLLKCHDDIELIPLLDQFHQVMMNEVFTFIVQSLLPGLLPAQRYHSSLAEEVRNMDKEYLPVIVVGHTINGREFNWEMINIPDDLLSELGIVLKHNNTQHAPPECLLDRKENVSGKN